MTVIFFFGLLNVVLWTGCSQVSFEQAPKAACNGFDQACSTVKIGEKEYNSFDYQLIVPQPQVDILFVDDNSRSMQLEQQKMGDRFPNFISALSNLDWRIAITTTDIYAEGPTQGGHLLEFSAGLNILTPSTPGKESLFSSTIRRSEIGNGDERGIYSANVVIDRRNENQFFRRDAHFAVVFLSDEDERSYGGKNSSYPLEAYDRAADFIANVKAKLGAAKTLSAHSIVIRPGDVSCLNAQSEQLNRGYEGTIYAELASLTNGILGDICASDYGAQLTTIGQEISKNISSIKLACAPAVGAGLDLTITVDPQTNPETQGNVSGDTVYFSPPLAAGTQVRVQYKCEI